ncbi:helix-turn-helix transcriptional regulator [Mucilaginibacter paludis]|uniref:Transcriptional regulator, AraC family n=1 Tax=Mucilaginibacter paludis DSM 18603 TaxID=714943 RepID=H1Y405_9SPHI|nr:helix-turn-helix transcriptional regulator [Mucilaginibacter paludis]EHQ30950.1 transcriptional regulator, AraC family [Mucilaginibacter paludis DSM 18603]
METLVKYIFPNGMLSAKDVTGNLPKGCRLPVSYARASLCQLPEGGMLIQHYTHLLFNIEVLEFNLDRDLKAEYELNFPSVFLFCMLQGAIKFYTIEGKPIYEAIGDICYGTFNQVARYRYALGPGIHRVFFMIPNTELIHSHPDEYPELLELLNNMKKGFDRYGHMPECPLTGRIFQLMLSLLTYRPQAGEDIEIKLLEKGKALLLEYHRMVSLMQSQPAYRVKYYLDRNYRDSKLSNDSIAREFKISKRSLTRLFKATFRIGPYAYLIDTRLEAAKRLLSEQKLPVNQVYKAVGYKDLRSFRGQFKEKFGISPSQCY